MTRGTIRTFQGVQPKFGADQLLGWGCDRIAAEVLQFERLKFAIVEECEECFLCLRISDYNLDCPYTGAKVRDNRVE